ncbi:MAG: archaemetzincin family Zn-dependent metalloprotease [Candidatus Bathyarchaeota archaeon]|nr:archaemetzincin family Zn-dependent metalloprotease [Candidatus Bathyarchaeota archaeon]
MRIAILCIGTVDEDILTKIQSGLSEIYPETACLVLDEIMPIPADAYDKARQQFHSTHILAKINNYVKRTQADSILGITEVDLYVPHLNFVFGEATCPGKTAIISLFRLKPEFYEHPANPELFINRCVKEAVHEIGHTLGLKHCQNPTCVMFFSNSILDTDRKKKTFCEKCHPKVVKLLGR